MTAPRTMPDGLDAQGRYPTRAPEPAAELPEPHHTDWLDDLIAAAQRAAAGLGVIAIVTLLLGALRLT